MLNSPCDGNCKLDNNTKLCMGCFRSIEEILNWINLNDQQRQSINQLAEKRKEDFKKDKNKIN